MYHCVNDSLTVIIQLTSVGSCAMRGCLHVERTQAITNSRSTATFFTKIFTALMMPKDRERLKDIKHDVRTYLISLF